MARAPGHPTSLQVEGGCGNEGSGMAKVRSHSPSSSSFRSWLCAQDAGEAEKAKRDEGKWLGEPKQPLSLRFYSPRRVGPQPQPKSTGLNAVDSAVADGWGPMTAESPTQALGNNYGVVTDGRGATVALIHPSAAAHVSSPTRGRWLKRRARTAPHIPSHVAHDQRKTRAHDQRLRAACEP